MADVSVCINKAVTKGAISKAQGDHLINEFNSLVQGHMATHGQANIAAAMAKESLANQYKTNAAVKRLRAARQVEANARLSTIITNSNDVMVAVDAIFSPDYRNRADTHFLSLEHLTGRVSRQAESFYARGLAQLERNTWDAQVKVEQQRNILKELNGISSGDPVAAEFAKGYKDAMKYIAHRYRTNGGILNWLDDWDIKHTHSPPKLKAAGKDEWVNFTLPLLDRQKMLHNQTGLPLTDAELRGVLETAWANIAGKDTVLGEMKGKSSAANKWTEERVLHFKDDAWFAYNERFGTSDIVSTAIKQVQNMSRDIAQMEIFGPNPELGKQFLKDVVKQELNNRSIAHGPGFNVLKDWKRSFSVIVAGMAGEVKNLNRFELDLKKVDGYIDGWFDIASGRAFGERNEIAGRFFDNVRGLLASAQLGSALLSATGDIGSLMWTAHLNGLPQAKILQNYIKAWAGKQGAELRVRAAELALQVEHLHANILEQQLMQIDVHKGLGTIAADKVLRWSGLTRHTDAARVAFSITMAQEIAKGFSKTFDQLDGNFKRGLKVNGIDAAGWDVIRTAQTIDYDGIPHLNLAAVERIDRELGAKLSQYVTSEMDKAIIMSGWKFERTMKNFGAGGQFGRFAAMYKRYPVLMMLQTVGRVMNEEMTTGQKVAFGMGFPLTMTFLGAIALTLKDLSAGRDPRDWADKQFAIDAFIQGGVGGVVGDYARAMLDAARQKRSADAITPAMNATFGPIIGFANDFISPWWAKYNAKLNGKDGGIDTFAAELPKWGKYVPGNNLWYGRIFVDRYFEDTLQKMLNPNHNQMFQRQINNRKKNYHQEFWWKPGALSPNDTPDWGSNG